jgi:hypothetical protein
MTPVHSLVNQYLGINAHLHSYWQGVGGWHNFHNRHIGDLAGQLRLQLIPMGYTASMEESLQIRRVGDTFSEMLQTEAEIEKPYHAIGIYKVNGDQSPKLVTWIELLAPTTKGTRVEVELYSTTRRPVLEKGVVLVEIDYLHEIPSTMRAIPDYTRSTKERHSEQGATPYRIIVADPRPDLYKGNAHVWCFNVDGIIPAISIPLLDGDVYMIDLGTVYRETFEEMGYGLEFVDYSELPVNFDRYSEEDQARIVSRMVVVLEAVSKGIDLNATAPLPVEQLALEAGLKRLDAWKGGNSSEV